MVRKNESLLTNDLVFKKVFTSKENRHLLKKLIETILNMEFESVVPQETYHIDTYKMSTEHEKLMKTEVDILATTKSGEKVTIELQLQNHHFFVERTVYYAIEAYRSNYGNREMIEMESDNLYSALRKTYGINIVDFHLFHPNSQAIRTFELKDRQNHESLETALNVSLFSVTYFSLKNKNIEVGSDAYNLQQLIETGEVNSQASAFILEIQRKADYHNLRRSEREMVEQMQKQQDILKAQLSSSRHDGIEEGMVKGIAKGMAQGMAKGVAQGQKQERTAIAKGLLIKGYELKEIQELTKLTLEELAVLQKELTE